MSNLRLITPSALYAEQVMSYKEEMLQSGDSLDGCAGLEDVQSFAEWVDFENRLKAKYKAGYVPSERRKGYASEMLGQILPICRQFGESKVLLTCDKGNVASQRTIIKNGGVLENEVADTVGLSKSGMIQRYWISL